MKKSDLLLSGFVPPIAPPLPRFDRKGIARPANLLKRKVFSEGDREASVTAANKRRSRRIKAFYDAATSPVINLGEYLAPQEPRA